MTSLGNGVRVSAPDGAHRFRIGIFDAVRGLSVISMALFHLCYDLKFLSGFDLPWFVPPFQDIWRASISWTFLFVAGCMCPLSRSNLKRGLQYGAVALAIWAVTLVASVDTPISFGIIYCMAACTLAAWALRSIGMLPRGRVAALVCLALFVLTLNISRGSLGVGPLTLELPGALYEVDFLPWLGIPGPHFSSGDYYPLLPYLFMYLCGAALGSYWNERGYPEWARKERLAPVSLVGRHALLVYVVHQPVLLALCSVIDWVV